MKVDYSVPLFTKVYMPWWIKLRLKVACRFYYQTVPFNTSLVVFCILRDSGLFVIDYSKIIGSYLRSEEYIKSLEPRYGTWLVEPEYLRLWKDK